MISCQTLGKFSEVLQQCFGVYIFVDIGQLLDDVVNSLWFSSYKTKQIGSELIIDPVMAGELISDIAVMFRTTNETVFRLSREMTNVSVSS